MTRTIPAIKTSSEQMYEEYQTDPQRALLRALLADMTGARSALPAYSDPYKIEREARDEFRRNDFSNAADYLDSLVKIVEFWRDLAENYHDQLVSNGATFYETGEVKDFEPFVVRIDESGREAGTATFLDATNPDELPDAIDFLERYAKTKDPESAGFKHLVLVLDLLRSH